MAKLRRPVLTFLLLLAGLVCPLMSHAVNTAPRISDREIIESLAELKAGQKDLQRQIDQLRQEMNQRFEGVNQRFDDLNRSIDGRFDNLNRRLDDLMALIQILIGVLVAVLGGILAWLVVIWLRLVRLEAQTNDINFLKEGFNHLQGMVTQLMAKLP